jgi:hypothetical protein
VDHLATNLTHLKFGSGFDQCVGNLPTNLTHLTFGNSLNQSINHLPHNLTHLIFELFELDSEEPNVKWVNAAGKVEDLKWFLCIETCLKWVRRIILS